MRTRGVIYALEPAGSPGLRALRRQLSQRGADAPPDVLGPVSALREFEAVCGSMLAGRGGPYPANRGSLIDDLSRALRELGPGTQAAAGQVLRDFQTQLPRLHARLDTPQGARVAALSLRPLFSRLAEEAVVGAAWPDTVSAFLDVDTCAEVCERRIAQLTELAENRGVDFSRWVSTAEGLLGDDAWVLSRYEEGVAVDTSAGPQFGRVDEERRVELCEQALAELASRSAVAVWLVIDNAAIRSGFLAVGPVWFFDGRLWPDGARSGTSMKQEEGLSPPQELVDWDAAKGWFEHLPSVGHRVFARVWFDDASVTRAREHARRVVRDMIDVANSTSHWKLLDGAVSWREGGGWSGSTFMDATAGDRLVHPVHERTATELDTFDRGLVTRWVP